MDRNGKEFIDIWLRASAIFRKSDAKILLEYSQKETDNWKLMNEERFDEWQSLSKEKHGISFA